MPSIFAKTLNAIRKDIPAIQDDRYILTGMSEIKEKNASSAMSDAGEKSALGDGFISCPDLTEKAIIDGWLHTGDLGYVDDEGFLFLVDRMKDMIISGGVNVFPKDIEEVIIRHPEISQVAVIGVPDDKWGEVPVAAVIPVPGADLDAKSLIGWINERVDAKFQRVHDVMIMKDFPLNVAGKVLKREMREMYNTPSIK